MEALAGDREDAAQKAGAVLAGVARLSTAALAVQTGRPAALPATGPGHDLGAGRGRKGR
ncbi:MAG: hypothetical protein AB1445_13840 [Bacillota bacterium]